MGKKAKVTVFEPIEGQRHFQGLIVSAKDGKVVVDDITGKKVTIEIQKIAKANLAADI